jgi:Ca-activated chloride channel homolog
MSQHASGPSSVSPSPFRRPAMVGLLALLGVGGGGALFLRLSRSSGSSEPALQDTPDRFVHLEFEQPGANPDAGNGATARREEGKVGKREARSSTSRGDKVEQQKRALDREIAENAGALGALQDGVSVPHPSEGFNTKGQVTSGIGDLIGAKGTQVGSGGLAARGIGVGGGGTAESFGGLSTMGRSSGAGYGAPPSSTQVPAQANRQQLGTERTVDYGTNPMTLAAKDNHSTFSIDVDTASYAIARSSLSGGHLPTANGVRVEEFVNAMDYSYVGPKNGAPFAVNMEAAPSPLQPGHHVLRVGVQGQKVAASDRKPVRLTFLVDVSGSMSANGRLDLAQQSLKGLVDNLGPEDSVALVTYAGSTAVVLHPTPVSERAVIHAAIDQLRAGGSTAMGAGIDLAYTAASQAYVPGAENRVVILSDGDANVGQTSHEQLLATIQRHASRGITLSTVGFGRGNYQDVMMEQLADKGDGNYSYIDTIAEGKRVFGEKLAGTIHTIARDVKIQVDFDPTAVMAYRLIGYENRDIADKDFRNDKVDAGEIGSGHQVTALYDVVLSDAAAKGDSKRLATVRLRAKPAGPDAPAAEWETEFAPRLLKAELADTSASFRLALGSATFAELLRGSPYVEEQTYAAAWVLVADAKRDGYPNDPRVTELLGLIEAAGRLTGEAMTVARR